MTRPMKRALVVFAITSVLGLRVTSTKNWSRLDRPDESVIVVVTAYEPGVAQECEVKTVVGLQGETSATAPSPKS